MELELEFITNTGIVHNVMCTLVCSLLIPCGSTWTGHADKYPNLTIGR